MGTPVVTCNLARHSGARKRVDLPSSSALGADAGQVRFLLAVSDQPARKSLTTEGEMLVTLTFASWNQIAGWLGRLAALRTLREAA